MPLNKNELVIAYAGSGKTYKLVNEAFSFTGGRVLITTFTIENTNEIKKIFYKEHKCIPNHVDIFPWFTFLLKHWIRPYQGFVTKERIKGIELVNQQSGFRYFNKNGKPVYWKDTFLQHYLTKDHRVYSDKISKLALLINQIKGNRVIDRLTSMYKAVFIDEVQDLAGYDFEIVKSLMKSNARVLMVGDPRQTAYSTHFSRKNSKYNDGKIIDFLKDNCKRIPYYLNETELINSKRCNQPICDFANELYPNYVPGTSTNVTITGHDGIFFVLEEDLLSYMTTFTPMQLRVNKSKKVLEKYPVNNFGNAKGTSYDRVIIYPTGPFINWLEDSSSILADKSRSRLYVAVTRARHSVAILLDTKTANRLGVNVWRPS